MQRIYWLGLVFLALAASTPAPAAESQHIYLVRHAEKAADGSSDPELTESGKKRAQNLAEWLVDKNITAIYTTDYSRTRQTAQPLAELSKIKPTLYDPRQLNEFATEISQVKGNLLIVGHSNTTPYLAHLLGGDFHADIDESEYDRLYQLSKTNSKVVTRILRTSPEQIHPPVIKVPFNLSQFSAMENRYQMSHNGKVVGESIHSLRKINNQIVLHEKTLIDSMNINADIEVHLDPKRAQAKSMKMSGSLGSPVDIDLTWRNDRLVGHSLMDRAPYKAQGKISIDQPNVKPSLERTAAIMLAHLIKVSPDKPFSFRWYNSYDNSYSNIEVRDLGVETINVSAGEFNTRKIQLLGGAPSQVFYVSKEEHPKIIKIEVMAMPWTYELVSSKRL